MGFRFLSASSLSVAGVGGLPLAPLARFPPTGVYDLLPSPSGEGVTPESSPCGLPLTHTPKPELSPATPGPGRGRGEPRCGAADTRSPRGISRLPGQPPSTPGRPAVPERGPPEASRRCWGRAGARVPLCAIWRRRLACSCGVTTLLLYCSTHRQKGDRRDYHPLHPYRRSANIGLTGGGSSGGGRSLAAPPSPRASASPPCPRKGECSESLH